MASKSTPRDTAAEPTDSAVATQNVMADMTRQQLANTASTASAVFRALDSFQQAQQHMLQRAALIQSQTADRLRGAASASELVALQSNLVLSGWNEIAQYTQEIINAAVKAQGEFMRPADDDQPKANMAATPLFQAWQSMMAASMNSANSAAHASSRHH
jgi:hypothetical protein